MAHQMSLPGQEGPYDDDARLPALTTPFEEWCGRLGIHPDAPSAWDLYTHDILGLRPGPDVA